MVRRTSLNRKPRSGVAAVELAVLLIPLLIFWCCVIELGRIIQVDQVVTNATRDGARTAALAFNIRLNPGTTNYTYYSVVVKPGDPAATGTTPLSVQSVVYGHLAAHKIKTITGVTIDFEFLTGDLSRTQPHQGTKVDNFRLKVSVAYDNFRWINIPGFRGAGMGHSSSGVQGAICEVKWKMLVDDAFNINTNIPGWDGN